VICVVVMVGGEKRVICFVGMVAARVVENSGSTSVI
jgi:hypothetical protein